LKSFANFSKQESLQLTSRAILRSILNVGNLEKAEICLFKFPKIAHIPTVTTH
jgi:hypothetical protein